MFKNYKDIVFWLYAILWLIITLTTWFITGTAVISIIINYVMIAIFSIIVIIRYRNDKFYNWLETPLKKKYYDNRSR